VPKPMNIKQSSKSVKIKLKLQLPHVWNFVAQFIIWELSLNYNIDIFKNM